MPDKEASSLAIQWEDSALLSPHENKVCRLKIAEGRSFGEIAQQIGLPIEDVRRLFNSAGRVLLWNGVQVEIR